MDNIIGVKERGNFGNYEKLVKAGRSFIVMKRPNRFLRSTLLMRGWETVGF